MLAALPAFLPMCAGRQLLPGHEQRPAQLVVPPPAARAARGALVPTLRWAARFGVINRRPAEPRQDCAFCRKSAMASLGGTPTYLAMLNADVACGADRDQIAGSGYTRVQFDSLSPRSPDSVCLLAGLCQDRIEQRLCIA